MAPVRRSVTPLPVEPAEPKKPARKVSSRSTAAVAAERKALAIRRHAEVASPEEIAAETGLSVQTVKGWMRDKEAFPPHPPKPAPEPTEDPRVAIAEAMWAEGKTYGPIIKVTGFTRGELGWIMKQDRVRFPIKDRSAATRAVAARRRSGVDQLAPSIAVRPGEVDETPVSVDAAPDSTPVQADPVDAPRAAPDTRAEAIAALFDAEIEEADDRPIDENAWRSPRGREPIGLMSLTNATCRWPLHHDCAGAQLFCGAATVENTSWCAEHVERAFDKATRLRLQQQRRSSTYHVGRGTGGPGVQTSGAAWAH